MKRTVPSLRGWAVLVGWVAPDVCHAPGWLVVSRRYGPKLIRIPGLESRN